MCIRDRTEILAANAEDMAAGREKQLKDSLLDRLLLSPERLADMAEGLRQVAALQDPVGEIIGGSTLPNGLTVTKIRVPLGDVYKRQGSYYVEALTDKIEKEAYEYITKIDEMGGAVAAIEQGYMQSEMASHAYEYQRDIETGHRTVVGVNKYTDDKELAAQEVISVDLSVAERQIKKVNAMKQKRDDAAVAEALSALRKACEGEENTMPYLIAAVKTYATLGEICGVMKEVFGEYKMCIRDRLYSVRLL